MIGRLGAARVPSRLVRGLIGVAVALAVAEIVTRAELVDPAYLPPASTVLGAAAGLLADPGFLLDIGATLLAWGLGMAIAAAIAIPVGVALGSSHRTEIGTMAVIDLLRPIPSVALIPLAILLLGRGIDMRVALVAYASAWPILFNTITGVREVDPLARDTARAYGFGAGEVLARVTVPSAAPFIATGMRISAGIALILAVSTELIAGGGPGIGTFMLAHSQTGVPRELLYAAIVVAGLLGLLIDGAMVAVERRLFAWHPRIRGEAT